MMFYKSKSSDDEALTYETALALMQHDGATLISKEADHILAKSKDGRKCRIYFDAKATIAKAEVSIAKAEEEAKAVLAAKREAEQAADVCKNEDDVEIDADSFNQLVKAMQLRTQCSPHYARKSVINGLLNGTLTKMLGGYGMQLAMRQPQTNAQAQIEYRAAMAKVSKAPRGSRRDALRQAYIENPDAFA